MNACLDDTQGSSPPGARDRRIGLKKAAAAAGVSEHTACKCHTRHAAEGLAGHSCSTVAGTWLMTLHALRALHGDELPVRGEIEVHMADARDAGATGVMASVAQLVTGAAPETGFHGIGGRFGRNELLRYEQPVPAAMGLRRRGTGIAVQAELNASVVPWPSEMRGLIPLAVGGQANPEQLQRFGELWQDRVRKMLVEHADGAAMVQVQSWVQ